MEIPKDVLLAGAALFSTSAENLRRLGGMDGVVFEYERDGKPFVLKFVPAAAPPADPSENLATIRVGLDFASYLGENGVSVARPVASTNGRWLELVGGDGATHIVSSSEKAPGHHVDARNPNEWNGCLFRKWGAVTGRMHALTRRYTPPSGGAHLGTWQQEHQGFMKWCGDDEVREKWRQLGAVLSELPEPPDAFGLIHNDLHPWNFMVQGENEAIEITVFDFDVCNRHWFMTDIGIALYVALGALPRGGETGGESDEAFAARFMRDFMQGYNRENTLDPAWLARLPIFLKYRQILLNIVYSNTWTSERTPGQEQTLRDWRARILGDVPVVALERSNV
jgi:amicoumacin kinase